MSNSLADLMNIMSENDEPSSIQWPEEHRDDDEYGLDDDETGIAEELEELNTAKYDFVATLGGVQYEGTYTLDTNTNEVLDWDLPNLPEEFDDEDSVNQQIENDADDKGIQAKFGAGYGYADHRTVGTDESIGAPRHEQYDDEYDPDSDLEMGDDSDPDSDEFYADLQHKKQYGESAKWDDETAQRAHDRSQSGDDIMDRETIQQKRERWAKDSKDDAEYAESLESKYSAIEESSMGEADQAISEYFDEEYGVELKSYLVHIGADFEMEDDSIAEIDHEEDINFLSQLISQGKLEFHSEEDGGTISNSDKWFEHLPSVKAIMQSASDYDSEHNTDHSADFGESQVNESDAELNDLNTRMQNGPVQVTITNAGQYGLDTTGTYTLSDLDTDGGMNPTATFTDEAGTATHCELYKIDYNIEESNPMNHNEEEMTESQKLRALFDIMEEDNAIEDEAPLEEAKGVYDHPVHLEVGQQTSEEEAQSIYNELMAIANTETNDNNLFQKVKRAVTGGPSGGEQARTAYTAEHMAKNLMKHVTSGKFQGEENDIAAFGHTVALAKSFIEKNMNDEAPLEEASGAWSFYKDGATLNLHRMSGKTYPAIAVNTETGTVYAREDNGNRPSETLKTTDISVDGIRGLIQNFNGVLPSDEELSQLVPNASTEVEESIVDHTTGEEATRENETQLDKAEAVHLDKDGVNSKQFNETIVDHTTGEEATRENETQLDKAEAVHLDKDGVNSKQFNEDEEGYETGQDHLKEMMRQINEFDDYKDVFALDGDEEQEEEIDESSQDQRKQFVFGVEIVDEDALTEIESFFNSIGIDVSTEVESFDSPPWVQLSVEMELSDYDENADAIDAEVARLEQQAVTVTSETIGYENYQAEEAQAEEPQIEEDSGYNNGQDHIKEMMRQMNEFDEDDEDEDELNPFLIDPDNQDEDGEDLGFVTPNI